MYQILTKNPEICDLTPYISSSITVGSTEFDLSFFIVSITLTSNRKKGWISYQSLFTLVQTP